MTACEPLCAPITGRAESLPLPSDRGRIWAAVPALWRESFPPPGLFAEDEKKSRIKAGGADGSFGRSLRPAVRVVTGVWGVSKVGSKTGSGDHVCGHNPRTPTAITKKQGSYPGKEKFMGKKERFAFYLTPEKKAILERRYQEDGGRSLTAFIENAVDFYHDYLSANNAGLFLPASVKSCLDGRWDSWKIACLPCLQTGSGAGHGGWHPR